MVVCRWHRQSSTSKKNCAPHVERVAALTRIKQWHVWLLRMMTAARVAAIGAKQLAWTRRASTRIREMVVGRFFDCKAQV